MFSAVSAAELVSPPNDRTFMQHAVAKRVRTHPAMLGKPERILPSFLARQVAGHAGAVVELGCYLGGSTVAILDGLDQGGALRHGAGPLIHSYDLFVANEYMVDHSLRALGVEAGGSFEGAFRQLLGDQARFVSVHAGDVLQETWTGGPIKLLYVDILWSWATNQHVIDQFYRALVPGSWLVHQDYIYSMYPWLPITMEWMVERGYFSFVSFAEHSTVAFRCERSPAELTDDFRIETETDAEEKDALVARSAARFRGYPAALLQLSRATQRIRTGDNALARRIVEEVQAAWSHPFVEHHVAMVAQRL